MESFLKDSKLDHLCDAMASSLTLEQSFALLEEGRPKLLDRLKELGVSKIPDRQAFAKAVANGRRELLGAGAPVVVCLYSTGLSPKEGRARMQPLLDAAAAAGIADHIVLDHVSEPPYAGACADFGAYVEALRGAVYDAGHGGRPWILISHSNGSVAAYGLARRVGPKVRAMYIIGRRPPSMPLLPDVFGVQTTADVRNLPAHELAQKMSTVYTNTVLQAFTSNPDESQWQPKIREAIEMARAQYSSPCVLCAAEDIEKAIATPGADVIPPSAVVSAPIFGIASKQETEAGETADKMEKWAALTSGGFKLERDLDAAHMDMPTHTRTIELSVKLLQPHLSSS
jgi:surfactin synthase thioesterase subunit